MYREEPKNFDEQKNQGKIKDFLDEEIQSKLKYL